MDDDYLAYLASCDDDGDPDECDIESLEMALQECGQGHGQDFCSLAGTEHCDFECPFRDAMYKRLERKAQRLPAFKEAEGAEA